MDSSSSSLGIGIIVASVVFGAIVPLGLYIWYCFALSRLFPKLGEQGWKGWVPILNEMVILERGGVPGWSVILYFLPIVSLYGLHLKAMAMIRIGQRFGRGTALVVLGFLLPPLWATLLARTAPPPASEHYGERIQGMMTPANQAAAPAATPTPMPTSMPTPMALTMTQSPFPPAAVQQNAPFQQAPVQQNAPFQQAPVQQDPFQQAPVQQNAPFQQAPVQQNAPFQQAPVQQDPFQQVPFAAPSAPPAPPMPPTAQLVDPLDVPQPAVVRPPVLAPAAAEPVFAEPAAAPSLTVPPMPPVPVPVPAGEHVGVEPLAADPRDAGSLAADPLAAGPRDADPLAADPLGAEPPATEAPLSGDNPWAPRSSAGAAPATMRTAEVQAPSSFDARANVAEMPTIIPSQHSGILNNDDDDDDLDRTVVVDRRPLVQWNLVTESGVVLPLKSNSVLLGRKPTSTDVSVELVAVPDETRTLSKNHARLDLQDEVWTITDLTSTNGVILVAADGKETELPAGGSAALSEQFILGNVSLSLTFENGPS